MVAQSEHRVPDLETLLQAVTVSADDFDFAGLYDSMRQRQGHSLGAIASFVGLVRDQNHKAGTGDEVSSLTLEHYPGMTEKSIAKILRQAYERWPLLEILVWHRVGTLAPSEQIVLVMSASAHRDAAFASAEFVMDYLKTDAVFWKKEVTSAGDLWVESTADDRTRAAAWGASESE